MTRIKRKWVTRSKELGYNDADEHLAALDQLKPEPKKSLDQQIQPPIRMARYRYQTSIIKQLANK